MFDLLTLGTNPLQIACTTHRKCINSFMYSGVALSDERELNNASFQAIFTKKKDECIMHMQDRVHVREWIH